ncbi:MAG TPA: hypothetical protein EYQ21_04995 [Flavobacteriales bacterium]|nr:hypothetical protein [Flavobacteriales bacterium]
MDAFTDQSWFQIAGEVILIFTAITGALPDRFVQKIPVLGTLWPIFNWLAGNVFNNINHPKGMAAQADVEKEIDEAKAKVRERSGMSDVLDGM